MQISTAFDIGQKVYLIVEYLNNWGGEKRSYNVIEETIVESIKLYGIKDNWVIAYGCQYGFFNATEIFATIEQAAQALREKEAPVNE